MAWIDYGGVGQRKELFADTVNELLMASAGEVGAADASLEEDVAGDEESVFSVVEHDAAGGVAGNVEYFQFAVADMDNVAFGKVLTDSYVGCFLGQAEGLGLLAHARAEELVVGMGLDWQTIFVYDEGVADGMVYMEVGIDKVGHLQLVAVDKLYEGLFLAWRHHTRVDDGTFLAYGIIYDIGIDSEEVKLKYSNFHNYGRL